MKVTSNMKIIENPRLKVNKNKNKTPKSAELSHLIKSLSKIFYDINQSHLQDAFFAIQEINLNYNSKIKKNYHNLLKKKSFFALKLYKNQYHKASFHYNLQLKAKYFTIWNKYNCSARSSTSIQTNDSIAENYKNIHDPKEGFNIQVINVPYKINKKSQNWLSLLAYQFYSSSLLHFKGIKPWKKYIQEKQYRKKLNTVGYDNYACKLMLKAFSGFHKWTLDSFEKPRQFRNASLMQKAFITLKILKNKSKSDHDHLSIKYREVSAI